MSEPVFFHLLTRPVRTRLVPTWNHMAGLVGVLGTLYTNQADGDIAPRHVQLVIAAVYPYL